MGTFKVIVIVRKKITDFKIEKNVGSDIQKAKSRVIRRDFHLIDTESMDSWDKILSFPFHQGDNILKYISRR